MDDDVELEADPRWQQVDPPVSIRSVPVVAVLDWYDGPRMVWKADEARHWLIYSADADSAHERWMVAQTSPERVRALTERTLSLHSILSPLPGSPVYIWDESRSGHDDRWWLAAAETLAWYMPSEEELL